MNQELDRRIFLRALATAIAGGYLTLGQTSRNALAMAGKPQPQQLSPLEINQLVVYGHTLLPILPESHSRYRQVAGKLANIAAQDPNMAAFIHDGITAAGFPQGNLRDDMSRDQRVRLVGMQENTPFFGFLRWTTTEIVMREPALWERLGYEGSAIEHGGYLHRGFDDIDWLPQSVQGAQV